MIKPLPICDECGKAVLVDGICPKCQGPLVEVEVTTDPPEPEDPPESIDVAERLVCLEEAARDARDWLAEAIDSWPNSEPVELAHRRLEEMNLGDGDPERRLLERALDPPAVFRVDLARKLGFTHPLVASRSDILAAVDLTLKRLTARQESWAEARRQVEALRHRLASVRVCLLADDVDGAKQLLSEAAPGAEGTHGAGPGAAEEIKEAGRA